MSKLQITDILIIIQATISMAVLICLIALYRLRKKRGSGQYITPPQTQQSTPSKEKNQHSETKKEPPQTTAQKLKAYMNTPEQPWRNPEINLSALEEALNANRNKLTNTIKEMGYDNFYDFIAYYRIQEFRRMVEQGQQIFIKNIHTELGFNSRSSAFTQFRKHLGTTPGEYIKTRQNLSGQTAKNQQRKSHRADKPGE